MIIDNEGVPFGDEFEILRTPSCPLLGGVADEGGLRQPLAACCLTDAHAQQGVVPITDFTV